MTFGSLFAGIGGFDLGLERAGMICSWQVEIESYCHRVLTKRFPKVKRHDDVKTFPTVNGDWGVDLICGGFPCQDISVAGKGAGLDGEKSGLWKEFFRIVGVLRPKYTLVENVAALSSRGLSRVLGDFASIGYNAEWDTISACSIGAPHMRKRMFILAHTHSGNFGQRWRFRCQEICKEERYLHLWPGESGIPRVAYGIPDRVDRVERLGNAIVPHIPEILGRGILEVEKEN